MKRFSFLLLVLVLLSGCNAPWANTEPDEKSANDSKGSDKKVTLEIMMFEGGFGSEWVKDSAEKYMQENKNVTIKVTSSPDIHQQLQTRFLSNDVPDLINPGPSFDIKGVIKDGMITPLDDALAEPAHNREGKWIDTFEQGQFNLKLEGKTYGLPTIFSPGYIWWYDAKLFEENGWELPKTTAELYELKDKAAEKGIAVFSVQGKHPGYYYFGYFLPLVQRIGGKEAIEDAFNLKEGAWKSEPFVQAAAEMQKWVNEGMFLKGTFGLTHTEAQTLFFQRKALFVTAGSWLEGEMKDVIPGDFKLRAINQPMWEGGKGNNLAPVSTGWGGAWYVTEESDEKEETMKFLKFLSSKEEVAKMVESRGLASVLKGTDEYIKSEPLKSTLQLVQEADGTYAPTAINDSYPELTANINNIFQSLMLGEITPQEFTEKAEDFARKTREDKNIEKAEFKW